MPHRCAFVVLVTACGVAVLNFTSAQPAKAILQAKQIRVDQHGDPLPEGAIGRIGTTRFRHGGMELLGFNADGTALMYLGGGALHWIDAATGKEIRIVRFGNVQPRDIRRFEVSPSVVVLSGNAKVLAIAAGGNEGFGADDRSISVIDTDTGKERKRFAGACRCRPVQERRQRRRVYPAAPLNR
jgi:hypothetical protein